MKTISSLFNDRRGLSLASVLLLLVFAASFGPGKIPAHAEGPTEASWASAPAGITQARQEALRSAQPHLVSLSPLQVKFWSGGDNNDSNWTSNGNWAGIGGGGPDDTLVFAKDAARKSNTNNFPVNTRFRSISIFDTGYVIGGNQIILTAGIIGHATATSGANPQFNPNIILDDNQNFLNNGRTLILNGVINLNSHSLQFTGPSNTVLNGTITGAGAVFVNLQDLGTVTVTGNGSSIGFTRIDSGQLCVHSPGILGLVHVDSGTLCGNGTVGPISVNSVGGGNIEPGTGGTSAGLLTANGNVVLTNNTTLNLDLNGPIPGTQHDQLSVVNGGIQLNGASLSLSLGFTPPLGSQFTIIQDTAGVISGQFAQGSAVAADGVLFSITYNADSVVLTARRHLL